MPVSYVIDLIFPVMLWIRELSYDRIRDFENAVFRDEDRCVRSIFVITDNYCRALQH